MDERDRFRERLERARLRGGRGWDGQRLPERHRGRMSTSHERQVYRWTTRTGSVRVELEMVHVPAGPFSLDRTCTRKGRTGAFWIGRTPVTWGQYWAFCDATSAPRPEPGPAMAAMLGQDSVPPTGDGLAAAWALGPAEGHPATVSMEDAVRFCRWAGLDLPTEAEWAKAARGDPSSDLPCRRCKGTGDASGGVCRTCLGVGRLLRTWPWGDEPPTPARCAVDAQGSCLVARVAGTDVPATSPTLVEVEEESFDPEAPASTLVLPARAAGASPYGCVDMVGLVHEVTEDGFARGGRTGQQPATTMDLARAAAVPAGLLGFRVALRPRS